jgi:cohesin loading factor subunit SCC2
MLRSHHRKCSKWVPNKKSAIGDKPAAKKNHTALRWDALPFAARLILTLEDVTSQQETVRILLVNYVMTNM